MCAGFASEALSRIGTTEALQASRAVPTDSTLVQLRQEERTGFQH